MSKVQNQLLGNIVDILAMNVMISPVSFLLFGLKFCGINVSVSYSARVKGSKVDWLNGYKIRVV